MDLRRPSFAHNLHHLLVVVGLALSGPSSLADMVADPQSSTPAPAHAAKGTAPARYALPDNDLWQFTAAAAYRVFHESCQAKGGTSDPAAEAAYLARLADVRAQAVDCDESRVENALNVTDGALAQDVAAKIAQILELRREAASHESSMQYKAQLGLSSVPGSAYFTELKSYNQVVAAEEAVLASIPFMHLSPMKAFVGAQLRLHNDGRGPRVPFEYILKAVSAESGLKSALRTAQSKLTIESQVLHDGVSSDGKSLNSAFRESLAQDQSLKDVVNPVPAKDANAQSVACQVDAKYGRGAQSRDQILFVSQIGLTAATLGLGGVAMVASSVERIAAVRGAIAVGQVSGRSASILGRAALAVNVTQTAVQAAKACAPESQFRGTADKECKQFSVEELTVNNCVLSIALNLLPTAASTGKGREILGRLAGIKQSQRLSDAESVLTRNLSLDEKSAIQKAHLVGANEVGKNGSPASVGNYTWSQIKEKASILEKAGFSAEERRALMEHEIVGAQAVAERGSTYQRGPGLRSIPTAAKINYRFDPAKSLDEAAAEIERSPNGMVKLNQGDEGIIYLRKSKNGKIEVEKEFISKTDRRSPDAGAAKLNAEALAEAKEFSEKGLLGDLHVMDVQVKGNRMTMDYIPGETVQQISVLRETPVSQNVRTSVTDTYNNSVQSIADVWKKKGYVVDLRNQRGLKWLDVEDVNGKEILNIDPMNILVDAKDLRLYMIDPY